MSKVTKIEATVVSKPTRKRVAAYARVSRSTDRLLHSAAAQISYYNELIQKNPEWVFAGVYADTGISGLTTEARDEFQRLIADCDKGLIDIVLCKSISRFARNTVDLLNVVRHLKEIGVEVRFEKEHISSLSEDGELMLTLLASFSQEESRSISENVKWGIRKRFQSGEIGTANKHLLGYQFDEKRQQYVIIPEEAEIVRWMFQMYIDGVSLRIMADRLNQAGCRSVLGNEFTEQSVRQLIFNDVYTGNIRRQKSFVDNPLKKHKVINKGELPQYLIPDCHEAIIDSDTYALVQVEMKRRESLLNPTYCFTGKVRCGICGCNYTRHKGERKGHLYFNWICRAKKEKGITCTSVNFSEQELKNICAQLMGTAEFDETAFAETVSEITVLPSGDVELNGKVWKNLHLDRIHAPSGKSMCFEGKIQCSCGKTYHCKGDKYSYWYCMNRRKKICSNPQYTNYQIQQISAYIMGTDAFSETAFSEQIDHMIIDGGLIHFHFKDGRVKTWQKV